MSNLILTYPLDLRGNSQANKITGEVHQLTPPTPGEIRVVVPNYGPFFTEKDLRVVNYTTGVELEKGTQWKALQLYTEAVQRTGKEVCSVIAITDSDVDAGEVAIDYHVVGGKFIKAVPVIKDLVESLEIDERPVQWGDVIAPPEAFPPTSHLHDAGDLYGFEYLTAALEDLKQAILIGNEPVHQELLGYIEKVEEESKSRDTYYQTKIDDHVNDETNPHNVTAEQVGALPNTTDVIPGDGIVGDGALATGLELSVDNSVVRTTRQIKTPDGQGIAGGSALDEDLTLTVDNTVARQGDLDAVRDTISVLIDQLRSSSEASEVGDYNYGNVEVGDLLDDEPYGYSYGALEPYFKPEDIQVIDFTYLPDESGILVYDGGVNGPAILQYDLNAPGDVTTINPTPVATLDLSVLDIDGVPYSKHSGSMYVKSPGDTLYILSSGRLQAFSLPTVGSVSNATPITDQRLDIIGLINSRFGTRTASRFNTGLEFKNTGDRIFVMDCSQNSRVYQVTLNAAWDLTSTVVVQSQFLQVNNPQGQFAWGLSFNNDQSSLYVVGRKSTNDSLQIWSGWSTVVAGDQVTLESPQTPSGTIEVPPDTDLNEFRSPSWVVVDSYVATDEIGEWGDWSHTYIINGFYDLGREGWPKVDPPQHYDVVTYWPSYNTPGQVTDPDLSRSDIDDSNYQDTETTQYDVQWYLDNSGGLHHGDSDIYRSYGEWRVPTTYTTTWFYGGIDEDNPDVKPQSAINDANSRFNKYNGDWVDAPRGGNQRQWRNSRNLRWQFLNGTTDTDDFATGILEGAWENIAGWYYKFTVDQRTRWEEKRERYRAIYRYRTRNYPTYRVYEPQYIKRTRLELEYMDKYAQSTYVNQWNLGTFGSIDAETVLVDNPLELGGIQTGGLVVNPVGIDFADEGRQALIGTLTGIGLWQSPLSFNFDSFGGVSAHIESRDNPHEVTKAQVGLGAVENFRVAQESEAKDGGVNNVYMTPLRVKQAIDSLIRPDLDNHANARNNPHNVTKSQVGLGSVQNYPVSSKGQAENGSHNASYMTPLRVKEAIEAQAGTALQSHINDTTNPHNVSKAQVGLGSVANYPVATQTEAENGTRSDRYMTPERVKQAISVMASGAISTHSSRTDNPHNVTKSQVGLGNVQNYPIASAGESRDGSANNRYMTPLRVKQAIDDQVGNTLNGHVNSQNNPHNVSKAQVGLGSVSNFPAATGGGKSGSEIVDLLSRDNMVTTPDYVRRAINQMVHNDFVDHVNDKTNPHNVTKSQVGLSNVDNFATASLNEAQDGGVNNRFVTPAGVDDAISRRFGFYSGFLGSMARRSVHFKNTTPTDPTDYGDGAIILVWE